MTPAEMEAIRGRSTGEAARGGLEYAARAALDRIVLLAEVDRLRAALAPRALQCRLERSGCHPCREGFMTFAAFRGFDPKDPKVEAECRKGLCETCFIREALEPTP